MLTGPGGLLKTPEVTHGQVDHQGRASCLTRQTTFGFDYLTVFCDLGLFILIKMLAANLHAAKA